LSLQSDRWTRDDVTDHFLEVGGRHNYITCQVLCWQGEIEAATSGVHLLMEQGVSV